MTRILFLTPFPHIGGGETALIYLTTQLKKTGFHPIVVVPQSGQVSRRLHQLQIDCKIINFSPYSLRILFAPGCTPSAFFKLYQLIKNTRPALIHLNHPTLSLYGGLLGKLFHIPVVATSHGTWDSIYLYQDITNNILIDRLLAITPEIATHLTRRHILPPTKISTIFLGVDHHHFHPTPNKTLAKKHLLQKLNKNTLNPKPYPLTPDALIITMACRFDFTKNHLAFLKIANQLIKHHQHLKFLLVGDLHHNLETNNSIASQVKHQLDQYLSQHPQLKSHTIFTDYQTDIRPIYHATDILCSTSLSETLPVTFLEAAACGLPIVSWRLDSRHHIVKHNHNGLLAPPHQSRVFLRHITMLITNQTLRRRFGAASRRLVLHQFTLDHYAKNIVSIYNQFIRSLAPTPPSTSNPKET